MVIGLSVDYVVHMADAYLESPSDDHLGRTKFMLIKMGVAVVNGATTTIGAAGFMCATYIIFFQKFGIVILVTVLQSLLTALFFFSAMMALVGPQGKFGEISLAGTVCRKRSLAGESSAVESCNAKKSEGLEESVNRVVPLTPRGEDSASQRTGSE